MTDTDTACGVEEDIRLVARALSFLPHSDELVMQAWRCIVTRLEEWELAIKVADQERAVLRDGSITDEAAPRPWLLGPLTNDRALYAADGSLIEIFYTARAEDQMRRDVATVNFLVTAVNSFDAMLEALKTIRSKLTYAVAQHGVQEKNVCESLELVETVIEDAAKEE